MIDWRRNSQWRDRYPAELFSGLPLAPTAYLRTHHVHGRNLSIVDCLPSQRVITRVVEKLSSTVCRAKVRATEKNRVAWGRKPYSSNGAWVSENADDTGSLTLFERYLSHVTRRASLEKGSERRSSGTRKELFPRKLFAASSPMLRVIAHREERTFVRDYILLKPFLLARYDCNGTLCRVLFVFFYFLICSYCEGTFNVKP